MTEQPRVFISYATRDRDVALRLYDDLSSAGANVFEFGTSAGPGSGAWDEVLRAIDESDAFICIVSRDSLKSAPVKEEVAFAYHTRVNYKPHMVLIPAILESGLIPPRELRRFSSLSLQEYPAELPRLINALAKAAGNRTAPSNVREPGASNETPKTRPDVRSRYSLMRRELKQHPFRRTSAVQGPSASSSSGSPRLPRSLVPLGQETEAPVHRSTLTRSLLGVSAVAAVALLAAGLALPPLASFLGRALGSWVDSVGSWAAAHLWVPWVSGGLIQVGIAILAWLVPDDLIIAVYSSEYALSMIVCGIIAMLAALVWSVLFLRAPSLAPWAFSLISVGTASVVTLLYTLDDAM